MDGIRQKCERIKQKTIYGHLTFYPISVTVEVFQKRIKDPSRFAS